MAGLDGAGAGAGGGAVGSTKVVPHLAARARRFAASSSKVAGTTSAALNAAVEVSAAFDGPGAAGLAFARPAAGVGGGALVGAGDGSVVALGASYKAAGGRSGKSSSAFSSPAEAAASASGVSRIFLMSAGFVSFASNDTFACCRMDLRSATFIAFSFASMVSNFQVWWLGTNFLDPLSTYIVQVFLLNPVLYYWKSYNHLLYLMGGTVTCPICNREVAETVINKHLDSQCQYPQQNAKLAPIFTSRLGKRGTETRPTGAEPSSSKRQSSPDVVTLDEDDTPTKHTTKRPKTENVPSIFTQMSNKSSKASEEVLAASAPLAERLRPRRLEDFVGQEHLTGDSSLLLQLVESQAIGSMILWGPPGCGKTTLARLLSKSVNATFKELSATSSGTSDVKAIFDEAKRSLKLTGKRTILFMDEIQRFNKAQQDIFLPYVENGWITLIGATTENPSFKLNSALLSRCRVFVLERLRDEDIEVILRKAIERVSPKVSSQEGDVTSLPSSSQTLVEGQVEVKPEPRLREIAPEVMKTIVNLSMGDARTALSLLELVLTSPAKVSDKAVISLLRRSVSSRYDRSGEDRYDMISALHKSIRGSDGSAALYWLARMLTGGEDPLYIARRLIVVASEDVGLADNHALPLAVATYSAAQTIGMPECRINLAHCVAYLAEAPKSTRSYEAYNLAEEAAKADETAPVPLHLRNAPTGMMKDLNYGQGYLYNPAYRHPVYQTYLPATLEGSRFLREEGDVTDKIFDENALRKWEWRCNQGRDWPGRSNLAGSTDMTRKP